VSKSNRVTCPQCSRAATSAIFLPSLAESRYVAAVCDRHDVLGDGERFSFDAMGQSPAAFLAVLDRAELDPDPALRGWLVGQEHGETEAAGPLTVAQAARRESVSDRTVQRWIANGELLAARIGTGPRAHIRIEPAALDELRRSRRPKRRPRVKSPQPSDLF
jgi:excisionase family DNA binding protein